MIGKNGVSILLTRKRAQEIILTCQQLGGKSIEPLKIIEHLGYVQVDTISVVERAHHHVFWTRNNNYRSEDLTKLVESRKVFEYWSHAASYLPMKDYRFTLPMKKEFQNKSSSWFPKDPVVMKAVLSRIKKEGPLRSKDFKSSTNSKASGWWDWKPTKKALERLFLEGSLEISGRDGFQKIYDLPERVIPSSVDLSTPTPSEYNQFLIKRMLRHGGVATLDEIAYLEKSGRKRKIANELEIMLENNEISLVNIEGMFQQYYALSRELKNITKPSSNLFILSPFDNFVIQRKRLKTFFDFDYQIECYVPEKKRRFGYFCLPVFLGPKAIGRIDCKAQRKEKILEVRSVHYEKGVDVKNLKPKLDTQLKRFAKFNNCSKIVYF